MNSVNKQTPSQIFWNTSSQYGLVLGFMAALPSILSLIDIRSDFIISLVFFPFISFCYSFTVRYRDRCLNNKITYNQSFKYILALNMFAFFVVGVFNSIDFMINPTIFYEQTKLAVETYIKLGVIKIEQADTLLAFSNSINSPFYFIFASAFSGLLSGCFLGLILSIFVKRS